MCATLGCGTSDERTAASRDTGLPRPERIIFVTFDTVRADHLSHFGYPQPTSPWFDSVADKGVSFQRAYSHSATTKPSHASMFTSLYPLEHGVVRNGDVLGDSVVTLPELLRDAGFQTAGFVSTDVPLAGNLSQGIEHWDLPEWTDPNAKRSLYRFAEDTVDLAIGWLETADPDRPLFLWVHVYDPHNPLQPPAAHQQELAAAADALGKKEFVRFHRSRDVPAQAQTNYDRIVRYNGEIRYADTEVSRLEGALERLGMADDALWILTSDHGQGLGAHGWFGHSVHIYNAQLHVPLVFWFSDGSVPPRRIDDRLVEHVDLLPTIAELLDLDTSAIGAPMRGRSLVPLLRGDEVARSRRFAFAQRSEYADATRSRQAKGNYEPGSRYALQTLDYKYLYFTEGPDELYDLREDPYELADLIDDPGHAEIAEQFRSQVEKVLSEAATAPSAGTVSEAEMERLRDLGYLP